MALLVCLTLVAWAHSASGQTVDGQAPVTSELLADTAAVIPGKPFTVGLYLRMAPGWHTYWMNPGDSGLPLSLEWRLPPGWKIGNLQWPLPAKHLESGDMITYGYNGEVLLMTEVTPPVNLPQGEVILQARASWLVCEKSCVPGAADLSLPLPVVSARNGPPQAVHSDLFSKFAAKLPHTGPPPFHLRWEPHDTEMHLLVEGLPPVAQIDFFPLGTLAGHPEPIASNILRIPLPQDNPADRPASSVVSGLLVVDQAGNQEAWLVSSSHPTSNRNTLPPGILSRAAKPAAGSMLTTTRALGLGFLGGFILNLMPCVLPVIALKIFGFLRQAGESRQRVFRSGVAFVAGIFAWFLGLAALVVIARNAGHEINWAFQFQSPAFVLGMMVLVFVFALNLLGVFELWLPGTNRLAVLSEKEGYTGAFLHGAFATLLATPCTAPFLGPALAFAFAQSAPITFAMFASIAAGMGAPYLILTAQPAWMRFLPKPGPWMVHLKQVMGFLMLGTVVWLLGVLAAQRGVAGVTGAAWLLLGIGIACWVFGTWIAPGVSGAQKFMAIIAMATAIGFGALLGCQPEPTTGWERWSPERVSELRKEGRPVFIDFTADWCLNCKYNEQFVLETAPVRAALRKFSLLRADWTNGDPAISTELKRLGRAGVPVYVVFPNQGYAPEVLPELLTQRTVLDALRRADRK